MLGTMHPGQIHLDPRYHPMYGESMQPAMQPPQQPSQHQIEDGGLQQQQMQRQQQIQQHMQQQQRMQQQQIQIIQQQKPLLGADLDPNNPADWIKMQAFLGTQYQQQCQLPGPGMHDNLMAMQQVSTACLPL